MLIFDPDEHKTAIPGPFHRAFRREFGLEVEFFDNYGNKFPVIVKKKSSNSGTFCSGIKSIILHYEIKQCAVLKGTYVGPNRVSFSLLKHDMNPIHPPKRSRTLHDLCISDMECVNRLQINLTSHRGILHGHATRRRGRFDMPDQTLGSLMGVDILGCMNSDNHKILSQFSSMLNYSNGTLPPSTTMKNLVPAKIETILRSNGRSLRDFPDMLFPDKIALADIPSTSFEGILDFDT
ncbi:hypothetical protein PIB30_044848 [Stylosanthes scabra]|uniref:Uncharacterized protein n=1 Tax=Stylosanthes scabra TaxID=79078 RepID=A0ABU6YDD2_9FABA|nr:hypothetical protein [Stylosanthes scabra]